MTNEDAIGIIELIGGAPGYGGKQSDNKAEITLKNGAVFSGVGCIYGPDPNGIVSFEYVLTGRPFAHSGISGLSGFTSNQDRTAKIMSGEIASISYPVQESEDSGNDGWDKPAK